tara:strand:- start:120 stop:677 length:558 start_codon:yes stop_codon:yes gene_type:complete
MIYSVIKNIFFVSSFFLYLTTYSLSEINAKSWSEQCNEDKSVCLIAIENKIKLKDKTEQTLATAYIQIGSTKERKMNLVDKEDQTYKLSEENKKIPLLFVNLPLNADLRKKPLIQVDGKNLGNLNYLHCNNNLGCKTSVLINNEVVDLLKKGKNITIIMGIFGSKQNLKIEFPLKGFTKAFGKIS